MFIPTSLMRIAALTHSGLRTHFILKRKLQNQPYRRLRKRKQAQQLPKVIRQKSLKIILKAVQERGFIVDKKNIKIIPISAKIESEISTMNKDDQVVFLKELGIDESGLNKVIRNAFELLNLCTFFTVGKKEVRS